MAGAGVKAGTAYGQSDTWAWKAAEGQAYCYDLHATILHLMGVDHEKLTARHNGIGPNLEDAIGRIAEQVANYFAYRDSAIK